MVQARSLGVSPRPGQAAWVLVQHIQRRKGNLNAAAERVTGHSTSAALHSTSPKAAATDSPPAAAPGWPASQ